MLVFVTCLVVLLYLIVGMMIPPLLFREWVEGRYWYYNQSKRIRVLLKYLVMLFWPIVGIAAVVVLCILDLGILDIWTEVICDFKNL